MSIIPQEKTKKVTYNLPETLVAWVETHAQGLNDSAPEYVVAQVLQQYRERETKAAATTKVVRKTGKAAA